MKWKARFCNEIAERETVWVAEAAGRIVGFVAVEQQRGYLDQLFIAPAMQGAGAGNALMLKAKELAPAGLTLQTLEENAQARGFYAKHGFLIVGRTVSPVNGRRSVVYSWSPS